MEYVNWNMKLIMFAQSYYKLHNVYDSYHHDWFNEKILHNYANIKNG